MPEQDGFDVLEYVQDKGLDTPTLVVSGGGIAVDSEEALKAVEGLATAMITKPIKWDVLKAKIRELTG